MSDAEEYTPCYCVHCTPGGELCPRCHPESREGTVCVRLDGLADQIAETFGFHPCDQFAYCSGGDNPTVPSYCSDDQCQNSEHKTRVPCTNRWHKIAGFVQSLAVQ